MGAGLAGSSLYKVSVNQIQFGNKLQGLASPIGRSSVSNSNIVRSKSFGNRRHVIFNINQVGGVGRNFGHYTSTGGVKRYGNNDDCPLLFCGAPSNTTVCEGTPCPA